MLQNPNAIDLEDLRRYDLKIKEYIDNNDAKVSSKVEELSQQINSNTAIIDAIKVLDSRVDELSETVSSHNQELVNLKDDIDENEAEILRLRDKDEQLVEDIHNIELKVVELENKTPELSGVVTDEELATALNSYATKDYTTAQISAVETDLTEQISLKDQEISELRETIMELERQVEETHETIDEKVQEQVNIVMEEEVKTLVDTSIQQSVETGNIAIKYGEF